MKMAILSILLWPKDTSKKVRRVQFKESGINVVTGKSGTGKSSLLHIVDYCLGSGKCSIPVGVIRQTVSWFGLHLQLHAGEVVLARRNPEEQAQTGDFFLFEENIDDPTSLVPEKNSNVDELKWRLNELAGLSDLGFDPKNSKNPFKMPASIRDMAAFNFQPQHIVANPHALFFKTDSFEHRQKLITIFPLVLGAVTASQLAARWKLDQLEIELNRKERELEQLKSASDHWLGEIRGVYTKARELGLLPNSEPVSDSWPAEHYLRLLSGVPGNFSQKIPEYSARNTLEALQEVRKLESEESRLSRQIADRRRNLHRVQRLLTSVTSYGTMLESQEGRLFGLGWFQDKIQKLNNCPLCGNENDSAKVQIERISQLAIELEQLTEGAVKTSPVLDREVLQLESDIRTLEDALESVQREKWQLEDRSVELEERRQTLNNAYRYVGRIEQALESYWKAEDDSDLQKVVNSLNEEINQLRRSANPERERKIVNAKLERFTQKVSAYVKKLHLERVDDPVHLNIKNLMLDVVSNEGRHDALWEIGSAENWMGYHIATLLTLHEMFLDMQDSPVPTFLMIDQPSQAYFPDRWPGDDENNSNSELEKRDETIVDAELERRSEDIAGVHRIFDTLALAIENSNQNLQIIVTEHAGEITWKNVPYVNLVGNWRPGKDEYLIPKDWISKT
ncbi:hypothetical protein CA11_18200 [Gimesia maris]|uniref:DUF3732 domain-containing protein n=1 Tax=Gimesia maris TaxID=122 RepID=UPI0011898CE7|nr:DUF3732 domain-containing protein [Gimesia maris]QDU14016.1 hypothetical protein CA11_18200 [Gimesia maris]